MLAVVRSTMSSLDLHVTWVSVEHCILQPQSGLTRLETACYCQTPPVHYMLWVLCRVSASLFRGTWGHRASEC